MEFPVLVADVGGTNARFGMVRRSSASAEILGIAKTAEFDGFEAAAASVLAGEASPPATLILAFAGPILDGPMALTNCPWTIDPASILAKLGVERLLLLNDFEAQSLSLPFLNDADLRLIGAPARRGVGAKVVLGPGTGLGVGGLGRTRHGWRPRRSEGGHIGFGPVGAEEAALWPDLERKCGFVTAEHLLSGPGLLRLYHAIVADRGRGGEILFEPRDVSDAARAGNACARAALQRFCILLGRFARDMALTFFADGGVYIAGGIAPHLAGELQNGGFRQAFESGATHLDFLRALPVSLITDPFPAFRGLTELAQAPDRFDLDLAGRFHCAADRP